MSERCHVRMVRVASELFCLHTSCLLRTRIERVVLARGRLTGISKHAAMSALQVAARLGPRFDFASLPGSRGDLKVLCPQAQAAETVLNSNHHCACRHICALQQLTSLWKIAPILTPPQQV